MANRHKRRRSSPDKRGKGGGQWLALPYAMAHHDAFRSLSGPALKVWVELRSRFNGSNNGRLHLSYREAATLLGLSKTTVQRAFAELRTKGFTVMTREGSWYGRQAAEWRCTDIECDGYQATRDWQLWRPPKGPTENSDRGIPAGQKRSVTVPRE